MDVYVGVGVDVDVGGCVGAACAACRWVVYV